MIEIISWSKFLSNSTVFPQASLILRNAVIDLLSLLMFIFTLFLFNVFLMGTLKKLTVKGNKIIMTGNNNAIMMTLKMTIKILAL